MCQRNERVVADSRGSTALARLNEKYAFDAYKRLTRLNGQWRETARDNYISESMRKTEFVNEIFSLLYILFDDMIHTRTRTSSYFSFLLL